MPWTTEVTDSEPAGSVVAGAMELAMGCCCHVSAMAVWHSRQAPVPTKLAESFGGRIVEAGASVICGAGLAGTERG